MAEFAWNNSDVSGVSTADPITNGGLVFGTQITYDTNGDGFFVDPSSGNYVPDPEFPADESYSVALYVGYYQDAAPCPADLNGDGEVDFIDISAFLAGFSSMDPVADLNGDGEYDFIDISAFLAGLTNGCP